MKLIKPSFEIVPINNPLEHVELCGRTCYKSEDKITADSARKFVNGIIRREHESVLEHFRVVLEIPVMDGEVSMCRDVRKFDSVAFTNSRVPLLSGNIRAFRDMIRNGIINYITMSVATSLPEFFFDLLDEFSGYKFASVPVFDASKYEYKTNYERETHQAVTVRFICDRGVSHELVRHRKASFSQESTRFCNYFGGVTFIIPPWVNIEPGEYTPLHPAGEGKTRADMRYFWGCANSEKDYLEALADGWAPQQARGFLNTWTKTEVCMSETLHWWKHFCNLRAVGTTGTPHPQMSELAIPLLTEFKSSYPEIFHGISTRSDS